MSQRNAYLVRFSDPKTNSECQFENHTYAKTEWAAGLLLSNGEWVIVWAEDFHKAVAQMADVVRGLTIDFKGIPETSIEHIAIGKAESIPPAQEIPDPS